MKTRLLYFPLLAMLLLLLPSCDDPDYWDPAPPGGNTFYDRDLTGCWELYQVNSNIVSGDEVNYMYFNGDGRGTYYYYDRGYQESERLSYQCQESVSGSSSFQINIKYGNDSPSTMNYWFKDNYNTLWMQWNDRNGVQTYVYKYYGRTAPW